MLGKKSIFGQFSYLYVHGNVQYQGKIKRSESRSKMTSSVSGSTKRHKSIQGTGKYSSAENCQVLCKILIQRSYFIWYGWCNMRIH
jgi:hypothetical protein